MSWAAWRLDWLTWSWLVWIVAFFALEVIALVWFRGNELTAHLRPLFQSGGALSPAWYLALGLWMWLGVHFLADGVFVNVD